MVEFSMFDFIDVNLSLDQFTEKAIHRIKKKHKHLWGRQFLTKYEIF